MKTGEIIGLAIGGIGVWWLGSTYNWFGLFGSTPTPTGTTGSSAPTTGTTPSGNTAIALTVADANTLPYGTSITQAMIAAINSGIDAAIQAGQVSVIDSNSVLNYMLGWGTGAKGATQTIYGQTYTSDGTNWNLTSGAPPASQPPAASTPPPAATSLLTVADANSLPYTSAITPAMMAAINAQVDAALQAGQITTIAPTSVLAYELGWGGATKGATKSVYGLTFTFDGSNWTLASAPSPSGPYANAAGNCPIGYINTTGGPNGLCVQSVGIGSYGMGKRTMTHARRINYQRKSRFA